MKRKAKERKPVGLTNPETRSIYDDLPRSLTTVCSYADTEVLRGFLLRACIGVLGGIFHDVRGDHDDGMVGLNVNFLMIAPPGSGKGLLRHARRLAEPIDARLRRAYKEWSMSQKGGRSIDETEEDILGDDLAVAQTPAMSSLLVPGNVTAAALRNALSRNGGVGLIVENEFKTLASSLRGKVSEVRPMILSSSENEPVTGARNQSETIIDRGALSIVATGVPDDIQALLPTNGDGLFSRFAFYLFESPLEWRSHEPRKGRALLDEKVNDIARCLDEQHQRLTERTTHLVVKMAKPEWREHTRRLKEMLNLVAGDPKRTLVSTVTRLGAISFRIACILTLVRLMDEGESLAERKGVVVDRRDLAIALELADEMMDHARLAASHLIPVGNIRADSRAIALLTALPATFRAVEAVSQGEMLGLSRRTVFNRLGEWVRDGVLTSRRQGEYTRPNA